ncbi:SDR family NAD(P)-dependent oxidoreductase [Streptomyces albidoflavus]
MDLAADHPGQDLAARVDRLGVHVTSLINNAGFATFGPFHQADPERLCREIAVDVTAVADISRAFIDQLRTAGSGALVNVASMAAYQPNPRMALYGATKAFVLSLTEALWEESRGTGLRVLALSPGATRTEFFDVVGTTQAAGGTRLSSPVDVVRTALAALDRRNPPPSVIAGRMNRVMAFVARRLATRRQVVRTIGRLTAEGGMRREGSPNGNDDARPFTCMDQDRRPAPRPHLPLPRQELRTRSPVPVRPHRGPVPEAQPPRPVAPHQPHPLLPPVREPQLDRGQVRRDRVLEHPRDGPAPTAPVRPDPLPGRGLAPRVPGRAQLREPPPVARRKPLVVDAGEQFDAGLDLGGVRVRPGVRRLLQGEADLGPAPPSPGLA